MKLGEKVTFEANGKIWTLKPFTLGIWFAFIDWAKANKPSDPLADVAKLPLERMPTEEANQLVRDAVAQDKAQNDFRPESPATMERLATPQGLMQSIFLLAGGAQGQVTYDEVDEMVSGFIFNGEAATLMGYLARCMGTPAKKKDEPDQVSPPSGTKS